MTDSVAPIRRQATWFRVGRAGRRQGIVLLYPDKLAVVNSWAELWGTILGPLVLVALSHLFFHDVGAVAPAVGIPVGGWLGQGIGKRLAAGRVAANGAGVRLIPLDQITGVQVRKPAGLRRWLMGQVLLVTTADAAEYEFRGRMDGWQAALAGALTVRGREVYGVNDAITVMPRVSAEEG
jgi:hypothetical protein